MNCGAIVENLFESELFGHKRGSFTGATIDKEGFFKSADGGSIFLDEVSEIPLHLQVKLLRAIELKEITPVGTSIAQTIDVRIIASTNKNLEKEVEAGRYREDLFYRLNIVEINLPSPGGTGRRYSPPRPALRCEVRTEMNKDVQGVDNEVMKCLLSHSWKGEIRELENIIERAVIFCGGEASSRKGASGILRATPGHPVLL